MCLPEGSVKNSHAPTFDIIMAFCLLSGTFQKIAILLEGSHINIMENHLRCIFVLEFFVAFCQKFLVFSTNRDHYYDRSLGA